MDDKNDPLRKLLGEEGSGSENVNSKPALASARRITEVRGLKPLDLLNLPATQQRIIKWLSHRKQASLDEIKADLGDDTPADEIEAAITALREPGYIREILAGGAIEYRVVFGGTATRITHALPKDLWARLDQDKVTFLKGLPLFREVPDPELLSFAVRLETRRYGRNDVILWQGSMSEGVHLIKSGIVGITHVSRRSQDTKVLNYQKQGDMFGEYSLLAEQSHPASATATALSEVEVLLLKRADFFDLLNRHPSVGTELARLLARRLIDTSSRFTDEAAAKISLVFGISSKTISTMVGSALATVLARTTKNPTAYTEYPVSHQLPSAFNFDPDLEIYKHPAGYEIVSPRDTPGVPRAVRTTLVHDQLASNYDNIVIGLPAKADDAFTYLLERASQVVIVTPPNREGWHQVSEFLAFLKSAIHPENTTLFTIVNHGEDEDSDAMPPTLHADFDIPTLDINSPLGQRKYEDLPEPLLHVVLSLADRLGRTNQICVYIPTTVDVDKTLDTSVYVEKTLAFMGRLFGGATSSQASGVWNSHQAGLVSEVIYLVRSYVKQSDLDKHLGEVLEFVEKMKVDLKQEAMALEVNQKLMLI